MSEGPVRPGVCARDRSCIVELAGRLRRLTASPRRLWAPDYQVEVRDSPRGLPLRSVPGLVTEIDANGTLFALLSDGLKALRLQRKVRI